MVKNMTPRSQKSTPKCGKELDTSVECIKAEDTVTFTDIGGLKRQLQQLQDLIILRFKNRESVRNLGITPPTGILLFGFPGTGKTLSVRAIRNELGSDVHFIKTDGGDIFSKSSLETEKKLALIFTEAVKKCPSVVFIDDIDLLCSNKRNATEQEKRILSCLFSYFDNLQNTEVVIVAATNKIDSVDTSLRRPGRFDVEIEFTVPLAKERVEIMNTILSKANHEISSDLIEKLAQTAYSFTGADLMLACRKAALNAVKGNCKITENELRTALKTVKPSAMREIMLEVPPIYWSDIGGMHEVKAKLRQAVVMPLTHPEAFKRMGIAPPKGILLYGPPGCSKTMVGKALATESKFNFISIKGPELFSKWVGESERAVRELFRKAKQASPAIIFFDEIDALAAERGGNENASAVGDRVLAQLLTEMDGIESLDGVIIVAATNRPDKIDKALLRRGRIGTIIYVPLPDAITRSEILRIKIKQMPVEFESNNLNIDEIVKRTEGFSGAEVIALCEEAALAALEEDIDSKIVCFRHFIKVLQSMVARTSSDMIEYYENYNCKNIQVEE
ncbi:spermatogenesis-associated protein 5-like protein [Dinothrombium tinctorium]|uniref:Spermatogenesis-associated protein 5-like protein n=1 Tax=Dinothrombium tinctorium TaxID=1965070 RepID=A0A3S3P7X0_9ACAR|nr:spermatogenesis-associated protein 5-like protein [Dinothrombium tinctorium]RWS03017.1 spermatogenesis-associated protein 5-like protein [Dinothrombium tinctorium]